MVIAMTVKLCADPSRTEILRYDLQTRIYHYVRSLSQKEQESVRS